MDRISSSLRIDYGLPAQTYGSETGRPQQTTDDSQTDDSTLPSSGSASPQSQNNALTSAEENAVRALKKRDTQVRQHEQAHLAAAGGLVVSGATFSMQTGPDGQRYAIGGEVRIDLSTGNTPEETVRRARIIQAAALAPADPSAQDRAIAARARAMEMQAEVEIGQRSVQQQRVATQYQSDSLPNSTVSAQA